MDRESGGDENGDLIWAAQRYHKKVSTKLSDADLGMVPAFVLQQTRKGLATSPIPLRRSLTNDESRFQHCEKYRLVYKIIL